MKIKNIFASVSQISLGTALLLGAPLVRAKSNRKDEKKENSVSTPKTEETPKKLEKKDTVVGKGAEAKKGKWVTVHYTGRFADGKQFDSSVGGDAFVFPLGEGRVIKGWDEGVAGMKVGGKRHLAIPGALAYGERGAPPVIPPNTPLFFDVELLNVTDFEPKPGS